MSRSRGGAPLACRLHSRDRELAPDLVGGELNLIARLDRVEHLRIADPEHHGHGWHVEVGDGAVPERDLALLLVDLAHFAVGRSGDWRTRSWCGAVRAVRRRGLSVDAEGRRQGGRNREILRSIVDPDALGTE